MSNAVPEREWGEYLGGGYDVVLDNDEFFFEDQETGNWTRADGNPIDLLQFILLNELNIETKWV